MSPLAEVKMSRCVRVCKKTPCSQSWHRFHEDVFCDKTEVKKHRVSATRTEDKRLPIMFCGSLAIVVDPVC